MNDMIRPALYEAYMNIIEIDRTLERIKQWREICPDLTLRSTFIVGSRVKQKKTSKCYWIS